MTAADSPRTRALSVSAEVCVTCMVSAPLSVVRDTDRVLILVRAGEARDVLFSDAERMLSAEEQEQFGRWLEQCPPEGPALN